MRWKIWVWRTRREGLTRRGSTEGGSVEGEEDPSACRMVRPLHAKVDVWPRLVEGAQPARRIRPRRLGSQSGKSRGCARSRASRPLASPGSALRPVSGALHRGGDKLRECSRKVRAAKEYLFASYIEEMIPKSPSLTKGIRSHPSRPGNFSKTPLVLTSQRSEKITHLKLPVPLSSSSQHQTFECSSKSSS